MCDGVFSLYLLSMCDSVFSLHVCGCNQSGYYIPDVNLVRENYRAVTPPIQDLGPYGFNIKVECDDYDTYKLVREGEPIGEYRFIITETFYDNLKYTS